MLLTVPNQLGVAYNAHVIEAILTHVIRPVCTENLNPEVVVMESAEDGERF